ncbi:hypothetical protein D3C73_1031280 [compost metagenome]
MTIRLQHFQHPRLLQRRQFGKDRALLHFTCQCGIVHLGNLRSGERFARLQANIAANLAGDHRVIAGQDFHRHTVFL